jgi:hypothetical protein
VRNKAAVLQLGNDQLDDVVEAAGQVRGLDQKAIHAVPLTVRWPRAPA